jgi:hypothetical protein
MGDTIVPMFRVSAVIAVETVSHVQELFGNHYFE